MLAQLDLFPADTPHGQYHHPLYAHDLLAYFFQRLVSFPINRHLHVLRHMPGPITPLEEDQAEMYLLGYRQ
jgi:hypothetical protein